MQASGSKAQDLNVIINLKGQNYAIPVNIVREMVAMPDVTRVPQVPGHVRGVINLRGKVMPLVDLRLHMGISSCFQERQDLIDLLHQREQDHKNWLKELRTCVKDQVEFSLATDPTKCAFGKWYYSFDPEQSSINSAQLGMVLKKFEAPHDRIHGVAEKVLRLSRRGDHDRAMALIEETNDTVLSEMIGLFSVARQLIKDSSREISVVLGDDSSQIAVAVDSVESVERLEVKEADEDVKASLESASGFVKGIASRSGVEGMVMLLDLANLLSESREVRG